MKYQFHKCLRNNKMNVVQRIQSIYYRRITLLTFITGEPFFWLLLQKDPSSREDAKEDGDHYEDADGSTYSFTPESWLSRAPTEPLSNKTSFQCA